MDFASFEKTLNTYNMDVVMCVDATGGMREFSYELKENIRFFSRKLAEEMEVRGCPLDLFRIKFFFFRDYGCDCEPMVESRFFSLPEEEDDMEAFVRDIVAEGGGDMPENALEALAHAMMSDWMSEGRRKRQIVLLFTDASAVPLGERKDCPGYPIGMPESLEELRSWWEDPNVNQRVTHNPRQSYLFLYAPETEPWDEIARSWSRCMLTPVYCSNSLCEVRLEEVARTVGQMIALT